jgi:regulator of protease activity HflC (stomatin/prohibitin superfamily)
MADFDKLVVSFLVDEVVGGFFVSVPPGHVACVYDRGRGVLGRVLNPGLHLKIPFWQVAKLFNAQILEYTIRESFNVEDKETLGDEPILTTTEDNQSISVEGSILFRIDKQNAPELWENIGDNFVSKVIRPYSRSRISNIFTKFHSDGLIQSRGQIEQLLKDELSKLFQDKGLNVEGVLLSRIKMLQTKEKEQVLFQAPALETAPQP